jgi:lysyl-tRNA synthetase class 2
LIVLGRLYSSRIAGTKLAFLDVVQDGNRVQGLVNLRRLQTEDDVQAEQFKEFYHLARRGDIVGMLLENPRLFYIQ